MKDIHDNLALIQPTFFTILDWFLFFAFLGVLVWVYFSFFHIRVEKEKKKNVKKKNKIKFSFTKEMVGLREEFKKENWKEFSLKASRILKLLLEKKYQEYFLFATGRELEEILEHKKINQKQKEELKEFFQLLDPIKFDRVQGRKEEAEKIIKILEDFN